MIQANELRIGNWVRNAIEGYVQIKRLQKGEELTYCYPIPLTKELLEKIGFIKATDHYGGLLSPLDKYNQRIRLRPNVLRHWFFTPNDASAPIPINNLHSLQNLWHILTGQELEIDIDECLK